MASTANPTDNKPAVYVTHGRKYHLDPKCPRMIHGEELHDWEGDDGWGGFTSGSYRREDPSPQHAAMRGKLPCLHCVPVEYRVFPPLYGQTFGHQPATDDREFFGEVPDDPPVCNRCTVTVRQLVPVCIGQDMQGRYLTEERWVTYEEAVPWPCTSAVVLGLAPRSAV